jgi:ElaB/YqjD/DUF883 family membrane-anchored ribosome-binding protein
MNQHSHAIKDDKGTLIEDVRGLLQATSDVAEAKVVEARNRVAAALDEGRDTYDHLRDMAVKRAKTADQAVHDHLYATIAIAFAAGLLFGGTLMIRK